VFLPLSFFVPDSKLPLPQLFFSRNSMFLMSASADWSCSGHAQWSARAICGHSVEALQATATVDRIDEWLIVAQGVDHAGRFVATVI